jgi:lipoprotein-releasing system ATP-binding protein
MKALDHQRTTSDKDEGVTVEVRGLSKTFRDGRRQVQVLQDVHMSLGAGDLVAVVGPSGSGKSTLLHLLGGLEVADAGEIHIGAVRMDSLGRRELAGFRNRSLGFVFQFHQLLPDFNALENVMMPGRIAGMAADEVASRAADLLVEVGLAERLSHFPSQLSGGERQRVAICRALLLEPPLLLADEPTGNHDPASAEQILDLLLRLRMKRGTTTVLVTHNPAIAARCGHCLRLERGSLRQSSSP